MDDKMFGRIKKDIERSKPIIIKNDDNISNIKKTLGNDNYTENISDSDELTSYKNRNKNIVDQASIKGSKSNNIKKTLNNENTSEDSVEYEFNKDLKDKVKTYLKADDEIRELRNRIKQLNTLKAEVEPDILKHLERLGETRINITGGKLLINQYESKDGFKESIVKEALKEKIKDSKVIDVIFEDINKKREGNTKIRRSLKRTYVAKK